MTERFGIVYLGSKEKILHLINYIFEREYKKKYFIDLFCGGLSVTGYALQKSNFQVIANDLNKYVIALYQEILSGGEYFNVIKYDWISRDMFCDVRDHPESYADWYTGYVLTIWSFGCNQKDYMYAKDLEENKHALHQAIVFNDFSLIQQNPLFKGLVIPETTRNIDYSKHPAKRTAFMAIFKQFIKTTGDDRLQNLERLEQLENLSQTEHIEALNRNRAFNSRLELHALDWEDMYNSLSEEVLKDAFIYCDPPYENTKQYQVGKDFDYDRFWNWFRDCPYSVYVSSYQAPDDIKPLTFEYKTQLLDNGHRGDNKVRKIAQENIYWNGKGNAEPTFADLLFAGGD